MKKVIDLAQVKSRTDLHDLLARNLDFPDYYGKNLDALFDCLTDSHEFWDIEFKNCAMAESGLGEYFNLFKQTVADAQDKSFFLKATWD